MEKINLARVFSPSKKELLFCMQVTKSARKWAADQKGLLLYLEHLSCISVSL